MLPTPTELRRKMEYQLTTIFGVGAEDRELSIGDAVSRCGLSFGGSGRPIRDAGCSPQLALRMREGARIEVAWARNERWKVAIRLTKPR